MPPRSAPTTDIGVPDLIWQTQAWAPMTDPWETSPDLLWPQSVTTFSRMRHDSQLKAVMSAVTLPILRASWAVDPTGCKAAVVKLVADDLGLPILGQDPNPGPARRRGVIWTRHLHHALDYLIYGHQIFERRYRVDGAGGPGDVHLDHLGIRMPHTVASWKVNPDGLLDSITQSTTREPIPANRLQFYVTGQQGASWTGTSMFRAAFGPWLLKQEMLRVHGTAIRRWGMGVPHVQPPPGSTEAQLATAQAMASAMRAGEQAGMSTPAGWKTEILGMTGHVPDALGFIQYLDRAMAKMVLAQMIELGSTETGARALGESFMDLFLLALQAIGDDVATTITSGQDGMPGSVVDLVTQNWGEDEPAPRITVSDIGNNFILAADSLQALIMSGAIQPDDGLEAWTRETWRLPAREAPRSELPEALPAVPKRERLLTTTPETGAPAPGSPAGIGQRAAPGESPPAPAPPAGRKTAAAAGGLRRGYTDQEVAAGFDAAAHDQAWASARDALAAAFRDVLRGWRARVVDQVVAAVGAGHPERAAQATVDTARAAQVIGAAMTATARAAAGDAAGEAAHQGITVDPSKVRIDEAGLGRAALAWAHAIAARLVQAAAAAVAGRGRVVKAQADQAGDDADRAMTQLPDRTLAEELGAALGAAQNAGRSAVFHAAPRARYVASEILDKNTCAPCAAADGAEFGSLAEAEAAYPGGHFAECLGQFRCRGTFFALWEEAAGEAAGQVAAAWDEAKHPRVPGGRKGGQFTKAPGGGGGGKAGVFGVPDSLTANTGPDGKLTPARQKLHDQIVASYLAGHTKSDAPTATFFGGGSASGKSTVLHTPPGSVLVDADEIKGHLPEYRQMVAAKDKAAAAHVHEESSKLSKDIVRAATGKGFDYTLDGTGDSSYDKMAAKVQAARDAGHRTVAKYVTVDTDVAVERAMTRAARSGRMVPEATIREIHASVSRVLPQLLDSGLLDEAELWDNGQSSPKLVGRMGPGGQWEVHDQKAWERFLAKGAEVDASRGPWDQHGQNVTYRGNLGIDRADMPQLSGTDAAGVYHPSSEMVPKFEQYLKDQGIKLQTRRVNPAGLKPTQTTGDLGAIKGIAGSLLTGDLADTKRVTVSADNRVLDGHHNWAGRLLAAKNGGRPGLPAGMEVLQADVTSAELIKLAREFAAAHGIQSRKAGEFAGPRGGIRG